MKTKSNFLDIPSPSQYIGTLFYSVLTFFSFPFLLNFFWVVIRELYGNTDTVNSWLDIVYHGINFAFVLFWFREYLLDNLQLTVFSKELLLSVVVTVGISLLYTGITVFLAMYFQNDDLWFFAEGILPVTEMDVAVLGSYLVSINPVFGMVTVVLFAPVIITCLYYLGAFLPAYDRNPWLGYLALVAVTAFPTICMIISGWDVRTEILLYFARLPLHFLACRSMQKTNCIFTPMIMIAVNNLVSGIWYIAMYQ